MKKEIHARFKTGARKAPRYHLLARDPFRPKGDHPTEFAVVPKKLSMWDNDTDGDCVTAQEAFSKAAWSIMCGLPELFIPDAEVIRWATKYGYLNGALLTEVMDTMAKDGFTVGDVNYKDGPYKPVDYSNDDALQGAIFTGPVNIAIDAGALPDGAGSGNGWWDVNGGNFPDTDHCVALCGYGSAKYLFGALGLSLPAGLPATTAGYLLFTWSSIGFVTRDWIVGTCTEAWVRSPTTVGQNPPAPTPVPPTPVPPSPPSPPTPPGPPVPPPPTPVVFPNVDVTTTGTVTIPGQAVYGPFGRYIGSTAGGSYTITSTGIGIPQTDDGNKLKALNPAVFTDALFLLTAILSKNPQMIQMAITQLIADLTGG